MEIKFVGTGGAFDFEKGTSSAIVTVSGKRILIDCGYTTLPRLAAKEMLSDIDYILITHLHGDHVGSLPTLLAYFEYKLEKDVPPIITPNQAFTDELHRFLTSTYEDHRAQYLPIEDFPEIGCIDTTDQHKPGMTSFAYYFIENDHLIYYSGDISNADTAKVFLENRTESTIQVFHETTPLLDAYAHASYKEVQEKLGEYDTFVYHIAKENMPADSSLAYVEDHPEFLL